MGCAASKANEKHFQYFVSIDDETGIFKLATNDKNVFWSLVKAKDESAQFQLVKEKKESAQFQLVKVKEENAPFKLGSCDISSQSACQQSSNRDKPSTSVYEFYPSHQRLFDLLTVSMFLKEMRKKGNHNTDSYNIMLNLWLQINSSLTKAYDYLGIESDEKEGHNPLLEELRSSKSLVPRSSGGVIPGICQSDLFLGTLALMAARLYEAYRKIIDMQAKNYQMKKDIRACKLKLEAENRVQNPYYDTIGRKGLLCILQIERAWKDGNQKDYGALIGFFKEILGFDVKVFRCYSDIGLNLERMVYQPYYCVVICISGHGDENGVEIENEEMKTIHDIKKRFGNEKIPKLAGVPKVIILDTCRGGQNNTSVVQDYPFTKSVMNDRNTGASYWPTTDSDCIIIHATTHGNIAFIPPDEGSVGIQGVMKALTINWMKDHLEEMLIDARMEVATWRDKDNKHVRQTLEIQSTLLKRLKFTKF